MASIELGQPQGAQPDGAQPNIPGGTSTPPIQFYFETRYKAELDTQYVSNVVTLSGLSGPTTCEVADGEQSVNGDAFTAASVSVDDGDTLQLRRNSSEDAATQAEVSATIEGVTGRFVIVTDAAAAPTTPWRRRVVIPFRRRAA